MPLLNAVKAKMELNGFTVLSARTVEQAMGYVQDVPEVSVIWLDHYLLGKLNGLDFVAQLKAENAKAEWKRIPIFIVSNTASANKVQSYLQLGVNKYYTKSEYRLDEIILDIKTFLEGDKK